MKIDRIVSIILILLEKERVSAQELAETFEVSQRTIYRDIDTINMAGVPVYSVPGVGGGFEIMKKYKIDKKVFSTSDLTAIMMGLTNLSPMVRGDEMINALAKVKSFIPAEKAREIEVKANQIYIDLSPWMGNKNIQSYLEIIKKALQESKILLFEYADRYGNKTVRSAEPYQLVLKNSHWYWYGFCLKRNDFRLFKISRTSNLQIKDACFVPRDYPNPQLAFDDVLEMLQVKVKLRIHYSMMDSVLDYCTTDDCTPEDDSHYIVQFPFVENAYHYNILFSFGDKCECLEPLHVREEMKRRINKIAALYADKNVL